MVVFLLHLLANGNEISNALDVIGMRSVDLLIQFQGCWVCTHTSITWSDHQSPFHFVRFNLGSSRKEGDGSLVVCGDWWFHGGMFDLFYYIYYIYLYMYPEKSRFESSWQEVGWKQKMRFQSFPVSTFIIQRVLLSLMFITSKSLDKLVVIFWPHTSPVSRSRCPAMWSHSYQLANTCRIPSGSERPGSHHQLCWRDWPILPTHLSNIQKTYAIRIMENLINSSLKTWKSACNLVV